MQNKAEQATIDDLSGGGSAAQGDAPVLLRSESDASMSGSSRAWFVWAVVAPCECARSGAAFVAILTAMLLKPGSASFGQCDLGWRAGPLAGTAQTNGLGYRLERVHTWDPDGGGPQPPVVVVAGSFGLVSAYNALTNSWQVLNNPDYAATMLGSFGDDLIAGGRFTASGSQTNYVVNWNGSSWNSLGSGLILKVQSSTVYFDQLYVGGSKTQATINEPLVRRWTGADWQVPTGTLGGTNAMALSSYNNMLIAGGTLSGGIQQWSEATGWQPMGEGLLAPVRALQWHNGLMYAGGTFDSPDDVIHKIASWNGSSWSALGAGLEGDEEAGGIEGAGVFAMAVYNGELIVAGFFHTAGGQPASNIARWNGSSWQTLGSGINGKVKGLAVYSGQLYAVGDFSMAGGVAANNIARWNGVSWSPILIGNSFQSVLAMAPFIDRVIVGGNFQQTTTGGAMANHIIGFNGVTTSTFGTGMNGPVQAIKSFTYPGPFGDHELIAAGNFTTAGGVAATRIARWVVDPINAFPPPQWSAMGPGFNTNVQAVERFNNQTYAAGFFINSGGPGNPVSYIARWNETTDVWEPVGTGMNDGVFALKAYNGYLYAGGLFTTAGGITTGGLARWNGTSWSQVGGNFLGIVTALEVHNGELVIGGLYPGINSSPNLAKYNGTSYSTFSTGGTNGLVWGLKSSGGNLYVGGEFSMIGGGSADRIGVWNGSSWSEVDGGADEDVFALADFHGEIQAGGIFGAVDGGTIPSPGWARYAPTGIPWFVSQPQPSYTIACQGEFVPSVQIPTGYSGTFQWRRNGAPLIDGPAAGGAMISGAQSPALSITNVTNANEGAYDCIVTNDCGDVTCAAATLTVECCVGDVNFDNVVDVFDLLAVLGGWGPNPGHPADTDGNDAVDVVDLLNVLGAWGACP